MGGPRETTKPRQTQQNPNQQQQPRGPRTDPKIQVDESTKAWGSHPLTAKQAYRVSTRRAPSQDPNKKKTQPKQQNHKPTPNQGKRGQRAPHGRYIHYIQTRGLASDTEIVSAGAPRPRFRGATLRQEGRKGERGPNTPTEPTQNKTNKQTNNNGPVTSLL